MRRAPVLPLLLAVVPALALPAPPVADVLLVTLDTTRADAFGCYGAPTTSTPQLDRLSRRGLLWEEAVSSVPITLPAHAVLLTGRYPPAMGVRDNGIDRLPDDVPTLPAILKARGYGTAAVLSSTVLDRAFGLHRGFDRYDDDVRAGGSEERDGLGSSRRAVAMLAAMPRPYFLWLHLYDPHAPYDAPPPFGAPGGDVARRYDAEVGVADFAAGRLHRAAARKSGPALLAVVAGDHGEALGDHGEDTHGVLLHDAMTAVPVILAGPGIGAGRDRAVAGLVDVAATVLGALGIAAPPGIDGVSLLAPRDGARAIYQETQLPWNSFGWSPLAALRTARYRLIRGARTELYDLSLDPGERRDVARSRDEDRRSLLMQLEALVPRQAREAAAPDVPQDLKESLASLGYVSAASAAPTSSALDPRKGLPLLRELTRARDHMAAGAHAQAVPILAGILAKNPDNVPARTDLATCHLRLGNPDQAIRELGEALVRRDLDFLHLDLGKALAAVGRIDDARRSFRAAIARNPRLGEAHADLAGIEIVAGRIPEARKAVDAAFTAGVRDERVLLVAGRLAAAGGDLRRAAELFAEAAAKPGATAMPRAELGHVRFVEGRIDDAVRELEAALAIEPANVDVLKTLGSIFLEKKGDRAAARRYFAEVLRVAPGDPDAPRIRELLAGP